MTEEKKSNLVNLNKIAKEKKEEKMNKMIGTSFSNLKGKMYDDKLDYTFNLLSALNKDFDDYTKITNDFIAFLMTQIDPETIKYREYFNSRYNLEDLKDGDIIQGDYLIDPVLILKQKDKDDLELPLPEIRVDDKSIIQFTAIKSSELIGTRVGEIKEIGHNFIKVRRGRRVKVNVKPENKEVDNTEVK